MVFGAYKARAPERRTDLNVATSAAWNVPRQQRGYVGVRAASQNLLFVFQRFGGLVTLFDRGRRSGVRLFRIVMWSGHGLAPPSDCEMRLPPAHAAWQHGIYFG
jgi:hypothetical protein